MLLHLSNTIYLARRVQWKSRINISVTHFYTIYHVCFSVDTRGRVSQFLKLVNLLIVVLLRSSWILNTWFCVACIHMQWKNGDVKYGWFYLSHPVQKKVSYRTHISIPCLSCKKICQTQHDHTKFGCRFSYCVCTCKRSQKHTAT